MNTDLASSPRSTDWSFPIEGMTCASCVARVEKVLAQLPGVTTATVNLEIETAGQAAHSLAALAGQIKVTAVAPRCSSMRMSVATVPQPTGQLTCAAGL